MKATPMWEVFAEMRRAKVKHGPRYVTALPAFGRSGAMFHMLTKLKGADRAARAVCDGDAPCQLAVLIEEVCEVADAFDRGLDPRSELVQVAAMALAMLGVEPSVVTADGGDAA